MSAIYMYSQNLSNFSDTSVQIKKVSWFQG